MTPELKRALRDLNDAIFDLGIKVPEKDNPRIAEVLFLPPARRVLDCYSALVKQLQKEDIKQ
jgi:hypothetical protein